MSYLSGIRRQFIQSAIALFVMRKMRAISPRIPLSKFTEISKVSMARASFLPGYTELRLIPVSPSGGKAGMRKNLIIQFQKNQKGTFH